MLLATFAPGTPTVFGVALYLRLMSMTAGTLTLRVQIDNPSDSFGSKSFEQDKSGQGAFIHPVDRFFLPMELSETTAKFYARSTASTDNSGVSFGLFVYDANYPTVDAEFRNSQPVPSQSQTTYASGEAIGTQMTFSVGANRGSIVACRVLDKSRNTVPLELWLFRASTTGGAGLVNTDPFNPTDTQLANLAGVIRIDDWFAGSTDNSIGQATNVPLSFTDLTGGSLYAWLVARGAPTYTDTGHLTVQLEVLKD